MRFVSLAGTFVLPSIAALVFATASHSADSPGESNFPDSPPPGASVPIKGPQQRLARNTLGETIELQDLDDPANPYSGQYDEIDRWFYDNYVPELSEAEQEYMHTYWGSPERKAFEATYPKGWSFLTREVDSQGWLVPRGTRQVPEWDFSRGAKSIREYVMRSNRTAPLPDPPNDAQKKFFIWASGVYPQEFRDREMHEHYLRDAKNYPPIPAWIADNPPLETVFVPNGQVLTYGPLGLHYIEDNTPYSYRPHEGETWYRYTGEGRLLGTYTPKSRADHHNARWQDVYADWDALEEAIRAQGISDFYLADFPGGGRAVLRYEHVPDPDRPNHLNSEPREVLAAYDFRGNPLDPDDPLPAIDWRWTSAMGRDHLKKVYAAQVELGLTQPSVPSPWAGTAQGPVAVDPTPRPPRRFARKDREVPSGKFYRNQVVDAVEVRPLDDPANPYREQYGPWDYWLLENFGKNDPVANARMNEHYQKQQEEIRKAKKEGRKPDPKIMQEDYEPDFNNKWRHYTVWVDDAGYQIPHLTGELQQRLRLYSISNERDYREPFNYRSEPDKHFKYYAGGIMPEEMQAQLDAQLKAITPLQPIPPVPAWLAAAPPYGVIFMPNGDVLTSGALGTWQENWRDLPKEQRRPSGGWWRFSADGQELGHVDSKTADFFMVYNPMLASLELSGMSQGYQIDKPAGFLIWRRPREQGGQIVAAWDYDGTPLSIDQPIRRAPGFVHYYSWEEVKHKSESEQKNRPSADIPPGRR